DGAFSSTTVGDLPPPGQSAQPNWHLGAAGLLWNLGGGQLVQRHRDGAAFITKDRIASHGPPFAGSSVIPFRRSASARLALVAARPVGLWVLHRQYKGTRGTALSQGRP